MTSDESARHFIATNVHDAYLGTPIRKQPVADVRSWPLPDIQAATSKDCNRWQSGRSPKNSRAVGTSRLLQTVVPHKPATRKRAAGPWLTVVRIQSDIHIKGTHGGVAGGGRLHRHHPQGKAHGARGRRWNLHCRDERRIDHIFSPIWAISRVNDRHKPLNGVLDQRRHG